MMNRQEFDRHITAVRYRRASRPSGKAFSFRLRDDERAKIEAAVAKVNASKPSYSWNKETVGSFVKRAALAAASATAAPKPPPATVETVARIRGGTTKLQRGPTKRQAVKKGGRR